MDDPSKEETERGRHLLREMGIGHEVRLIAGRPVGSQNSTESKKKGPDGRHTHSVEKASKEARKGSNGRDKVDPLSKVTIR